ncbi:MAG: hypothetical protein JSV36_20970 [Anaerolineae bacterium]|nr:MAG: hypothetical protein JSV36_20970 [Anaerolineae bacterium]
MSKRKEAPFRWAIWPWWVLLSAVGGGVGFALGLTAAEAASWILARPVFEAVVYGILGTSVAILQWLVLRAHVPRASRWVLASAVGWTLVGALADLVQIKAGLIALWPAIVGAAVGAFQWLFLRKYVLLAGLWILASASGWVLSWHAASAMDKIVAMIVSSEKAGLALLFAIFTAVVGAFTGLALVWLLRRPILQESQLGESTA